MFSILTLLLLFGCFSFHHRRRRRRRRPSSPSSLSKNHLIPPNKTNLFSTIFKHFFSKTHPQIPPPSPSSSTRSLHPPTTAGIHPCTACGEILPSPTLLHHHQSKSHHLSTLSDTNQNILTIIFKTGWPDSDSDSAAAAPPIIHRILKIHNPARTTALFETHREAVKTRAALSPITETLSRCIADGNELLRFFCTTFVCDLRGSACTHAYCGACGIIRAGFSQKMDGITTLPTSWRAHNAIPEDLEEEFSFMHVRRALLVCRVIAGRVGYDPGVADKADPGFDSLSGGFDDDELVVFNPRAVLPCFVIVYTV